MTEYWPEFLLLYTANFINLVSPGAGFTITARNSFLYGKRFGVYTGLGIVSSSCIHKTYSVLGAKWMLNNYPFLFNGIKYGGCLFLVYLGMKCFINGRSIKYRTPDVKEKNSINEQRHTISSNQAFRMGFITDLLNPMASIAFLSLYTNTVSNSTPISIGMFFIFLLLLTSVWFYTTVAFMFSHAKLNFWLSRYKNAVEYTNGSILVYLGLRIVL